MCRRALSLTVRSSFGEKNFFVCRLGYCQYALCLFEKVTRFALLAFFPVMSHTRSICAAQRSAEVSRLARAAASRPPIPFPPAHAFGRSRARARAPGWTRRRRRGQSASAAAWTAAAQTQSSRARERRAVEASCLRGESVWGDGEAGARQRAGGVVKQTPPPGDGAAGRPPLAAGVRPAWLAGGEAVCGVAASWEAWISRRAGYGLFFFLGQN